MRDDDGTVYGDVSDDNYDGREYKQETPIDMMTRNINSGIIGCGGERRGMSRNG